MCPVLRPQFSYLLTLGPHKACPSSRAPPVDTVIPNESPSTSTLIDVDSGVSVVPPDFREQTVKTETQATRLELEAESATTPAASNEQGQQGGTAKRPSRKKVAEKIGCYTEKYPLTILSSVLGGVAAVVLGVSAYKKYRIGELSWRIVGIWGGVITAATAVDVLLLR